MKKPTVKMFALLSDQGTACDETALCEKCYPDPANSNKAYTHV